MRGRSPLLWVAFPCSNASTPGDSLMRSFQRCPQKQQESSSFCCSVPLLRLLSCVAIILLRRLDGVSRWNESAYTMQPNTWHTKGPLVHPTTVSSARCLFNLDCRYPSTAQTALSNFGDDSAVYEHWMGDLTRFRRHGFALPEDVGDSRLQPTPFLPISSSILASLSPTI